MKSSQMSAADQKEFVIKHVFTDVKTLEIKKYYYGKKENHFNIPCSIALYKNDDKFHFIISCYKFFGATHWSFQMEAEIKLYSSTGEILYRKYSHFYANGSITKVKPCGFSTAEVEKCLVDGNLKVELHVKISEMKGIKKKLRDFDESMKEFSDIVLKVDGEKFYVGKMYLASQSTYFKTLFYGKIEESQQSEIELKDINKWDFQNFLEVLHVEPAIDEDTVDGILQLADMFNSKTALRQCEKFLMENSKHPLKIKFNLALKHKMDKLKTQCLSEMKTAADFRSIVPEDANKLDPSVWKELFLKAISFI